MISYLYLPPTIEKEVETENKQNVIGRLNKVNIFAGPNNSGKSRVIRALFKEDFEYQIEGPNIAEAVMEELLNDPGMEHLLAAKVPRSESK